MNNDVKQIINHWKVSQNDIKMDAPNATIFRFYMPMPQPKNEMGMTVIFSYSQKDSYDILFWTDDIVRATPRNQATINELISKTAGNKKWLELDNDGDLRYKLAISQVQHGKGYSLFNDTVLPIMKDCTDLYTLLSK